RGRPKTGRDWTPGFRRHGRQPGWGSVPAAPGKISQPQRIDSANFLAELNAIFVEAGFRREAVIGPIERLHPPCRRESQRAASLHLAPQRFAVNQHIPQSTLANTVHAGQHGFAASRLCCDDDLARALGFTGSSPLPVTNLEDAVLTGSV